jgi:hypothetical protein
VADFTDSQAVIIRNGGDAQIYGYTSEGGKITFDDAGTQVDSVSCARARPAGADAPVSLYQKAKQVGCSLPCLDAVDYF